MDFTSQEIEEFKKIFKEDYHEELSNEEAYRLAGKVINLCKIIYRPFPGPQSDHKTSHD